MSGAFEVRWERRRQEDRQNPDRDRWTLEATLVERILLESRPVYRSVKRLAAIPEEETCDLGATERSGCALRLGNLRRLSERDRWHVESLIARRIPKPPPTPYRAGPDVSETRTSRGTCFRSTKLPGDRPRRIKSWR
jgi:hypothetical protein